MTSKNPKNNYNNNKYNVLVYNIEWDVGKPGEYSTEETSKLKPIVYIQVNAPNEECAKDWALSDISENAGFLIQGCKVDVRLVL